MSDRFHYFSLQYSAIQKTILRHDRLWSMAGISMILSELNEIILPGIAKKFSGKKQEETILVAGGGKFTARFDTEEKAENAKSEIIMELSTKFPMLEFQISGIHGPGKFSEFREDILEELKKQKQNFRGYGLSFTPHLEVCGECGEYPAVKGKTVKKKPVCTVCHMAKNAAFDLKNLIWHYKERLASTTLGKIYCQYVAEVPRAADAEIPFNFEDLFPKNENSEGEQKKRMAVWFSDINSMKAKVTVWLNQEETKVFETFQQVRDVFSAIAVNALVKTFPDGIFPDNKDKRFLPFRIIIAGGDDFCIVMDEKYILRFVSNLSSVLNEHFKNLPDTHPLHQKWLEDKLKDIEAELKEKDPNFKGDIQPYCFGGSFIVCSLHTPFQKIHEIGEDLMKTAKQETDRQGNSVNWRIMAEEESETDKLLDFEKPVFIAKNDGQKPLFIQEKDGKKEVHRLSFEEYLNLRSEFQKISSSHRQQIAAKMIELLNKRDNRDKPLQAEKLERWLMSHGASELEKSFAGLLKENILRINQDKDGGLMPERLGTLLELLSIGGQTDGNK